MCIDHEAQILHRILNILLQSSKTTFLGNAKTICIILDTANPMILATKRRAKQLCMGYTKINMRKKQRKTRLQHVSEQRHSVASSHSRRPFQKRLSHGNGELRKIVKVIDKRAGTVVRDPRSKLDGKG